MVIDFSQLKKSRQNQFDKLTNELNKLNDATQGRSDDDRFWKPEEWFHIYAVYLAKFTCSIYNERTLY